MPEADPRREWEAIGADFARSREQPWPRVLDWTRKRARPGSRVLDLGAGHGRHARALRESGFDALAADFARSLLDAGRAQGVAGVLADARHLPLRDAAFDAIVYVASLHHIPTRADRQRALSEARRVARPQASALVTVWTPKPPGEARVPFPTRAGEVVERYYHFYAPDELRADAEAAGWIVEDVTPVAIARREPDNLFATLRRP